MNKHILGVHDGSGAQSGDGLRHQVVIPEVAAGRMLQARFVALDDDDLLDAGTVLERLVGDVFERNALARAQRDVGGDEEFAGGVVDAARQRLRAEPAKDDGMNRPDARAGQHHDRRVRESSAGRWRRGRLS